MSEFIKHYFACGNTAKGFQNFFASNLKNLDKVFILKGGPGTGKSSLMKKVGTAVTNKGVPVEYIHCSSDPSSLDGIIIREIGIAIVDGTAPHVIEPTAPGAIEEYVNLGTAWNVDQLASHKNKILFLQSEISACYPKAYSCFSKALRIHDEWEKIYINQMDFTKANQFTETVIDQILGTTYFDKKSTIMHRFFGCSTPQGPLNYVQELIQDLSIRYFIKGRPGSGKSTMLKKILAAAQTRGINTEVYHCSLDPDSLDMLLFPELDLCRPGSGKSTMLKKILAAAQTRGINTEVYHCSLDPDSLDMLLFPELDLCIFDSTAPHEYFPSKSTDIILDMYSELITPHTDEDYALELTNLSKRYKAATSEATSHLAYAKYLHDDLERYYIAATDFTKINTITDTLIHKILNKLQ